MCNDSFGKSDLVFLSGLYALCDRRVIAFPWVSIASRFHGDL